MSDLNLALTIKLLDRATAPLKGIGRAMQGLGRRSQDLGGDLGRLKRQQGAIDTFRKLKERLDQSADAMTAAKARAETLGRELTATRKRAAAMGDTSAETAETIAQLERRLAAAREAARRAADGHRSLAERTEQARRGLRDLDLSADRLADAQRDVTRRTREATAALARQAEQAAVAQRRTEALARARERLGRDMMRAGGVGAAGYGMMHAGRMGLGLAQTHMDFERQMGRTAARVRDITEAQRVALSEQAQALGRATEFTGVQAAQGQEKLAQAGYTPEEIVAAMPDVLDLAIAGDLDPREAADIASNIGTPFGLLADQFGRVGDSLTSVSSSANVDVRMLGETMKYAAPVASDLGVSLELVAAQAGVLGNAGIQGSMGGTVLRAMMQRLAAPTGDAAKRLKTLGVEFEDAQGNMLAYEVVLQRLAAATRTMGTAERADTMKALFGEEATAGASVILNALDEVARLTAQQGADRGIAHRQAERISDDLQGDVNELYSAADGLKKAVGGAMDPVLRSVAQGLTEVLNGITDWTKANPELTATLGKVAATAALVVTGVGGIAMAAGGVLVPLAVMKWATTTLGLKAGLLGGALRAVAKAGPLVAGAFRALSVALVATPIGWVVLAAAALAGVAYAIYQNWDQIGAWFQRKWDRVKAAFEDGLLNGILTYLDEFNPVALLADAVNGMVQWLFGVDLFEVGTEWMGRLRDGFASVLDDIKAWFGRRIADIVGILPEWLQEELGFAPAGDAAASTAQAGPPEGAPMASDAAGRPVQVPSRFAGRQPYADAIPTPIDTAAMLDALAPMPAGGPVSASAGGLQPFPVGPTTQTVDNSTVVSVTVPPGSDVSAIAAAVARELERRQRGALHDLD
ncbi:phage tail tape measure protein [Roseospira navarrensis]|uniref:Phage tail tape measure protein n=1 Tax=Roseospira navarrensis TaxID=140058 RepID=A0A7X1ZGF5_9PROT|nr:phage tail tape measure protein [Roseospira navarrensis]MQX37863.1 phage tail tape measure protein [Roseospira navarrensis]